MKKIVMAVMLGISSMMAVAATQIVPQSIPQGKPCFINLGANNANFVNIQYIRNVVTDSNTNSLLIQMSYDYSAETKYRINFTAKNEMQRGLNNIMNAIRECR